MWPEILAQDAYGYLLIFTRIGAVFMFIPAFGSSNIPARFRLTMALAISFIAFSMLRGTLPEMPEHPVGLAIIIFLEATKGIFIAMVPRYILSALHVAGTIIGFQGGLAAAQQFDPNQGQQGATLAGFFSFIGVIVIFSWDLHLLLLESIMNSFVLLPATLPINWGEFSEVLLQALSGSFLLGVQISAPFIVYALIYNISLGLVARLMPQLPVFFVGMPINLFLGLFLLSILISAIMMWFAQYFGNQISTLFT